MLKPIIAATAVLGIAGASVVYAQQQPGGHHGFGHWGHQGQHQGQHHRQLSPADFSALTDARIAALKAGLELTPDQQTHWAAFEAALREVAQLRQQRMQARHAGQSTGGTQGATPQQGGAPQTTPQNPFDRMASRADALGKTSAALKKLADAGTPLYQSLTDAQKARFKMLSRFLRPHQHRRMAFNEGGGAGGRGFGHGGHHRSGPGGGGDGGSGSQL